MEGAGTDLEKSRVATVFVDNLPKDVWKVWLYNLFSKFGKIQSIYIPNKKSKISGNQFGFVRMGSPQEAIRAIKEMNGLWIWGRTLDQLRNLGEVHVLVRHMGGDMVVLTFKDLEESESMFNEEIGKIWGEVIMLAEETLKKLSFAVGKILISTTVMELINKVVGLDNNGSSFQIRVMEEQLVVNTVLRTDCACPGCQVEVPTLNHNLAEESVQSTNKSVNGSDTRSKIPLIEEVAEAINYPLQEVPSMVGPSHTKADKTSCLVNINSMQLVPFTGSRGYEHTTRSTRLGDLSPSKGNGAAISYLDALTSNLRLPKLCTAPLRGKRGVKVKKLLSNLKVDMLLLQETKFKDLKPIILQSIWGISEVDFVHVDADGSAGGLITLWRTEFFREREREREGRRRRRRIAGGRNSRADGCDSGAERCNSRAKGCYSGAEGCDSGDGGVDLGDGGCDSSERDCVWAGTLLHRPLRLPLKSGQRKSLEGYSQKIEIVERDLHDLDIKAENGILFDADKAKKKDLRSVMWKLSRSMDRIWWQKSKLKWQLQGDKNSKFFHSVVTNRQSMNNINSILVNDEQIEDPKLIKQDVFNYFKGLYEENMAIRPMSIERQGNIISGEMAGHLVDVFTEDEIWRCIKSCDGNKALGLDGFNMLSIKKGWYFMKQDILDFMDEFHSNCKLPKCLNSSFITLVPKVQSPMSLSEFRPISLIGSGRNIQDGILIANEVVKEWKRSRKKGHHYKLDFEKAFDTVNWNYLLKMMDLMGFPQRVIHYSPFLFILAAEGLNWILKRATSVGSFSGLQMGTDGFEDLHGWVFLFRRPLLDSESEALAELKEVLDGSEVVATSDRQDQLIWQGCSSGKFSVKSIYNIAISTHASVDQNFELIWQNAAPPRVQCFGWLTYLGRVKTAEFLLRLGIIQDEGEALCSFSNNELETLDHLLLHCFPVWNCWAAILRWCGVYWVAPASIVSLFHWWRAWSWKSRVKVIWTPIPLAVMWSIWNARNQKIFDNKPVNWLEIVDLIIARIAFWVSSSKDGRDLSMDDIIYRMNSVISER
ncbi:hypothetical protein Acr_00g0053050 [Actinidia rufa]|uniref:RRM domain-containing protein n=1 Tax=Actinidia rufa TaxID=165716 RepID=A0A7J0DN71_9ERIC|nr:hypothetical protein Acr_00g0053050 [Actinidia rufa]